MSQHQSQPEAIDCDLASVLSMLRGGHVPCRSEAWHFRDHDHLAVMKPTALNLAVCHFAFQVESDREVLRE